MHVSLQQEKQIATVYQQEETFDDIDVDAFVKRTKNNYLYYSPPTPIAVLRKLDRGCSML